MALRIFCTNPNCDGSVSGLGTDLIQGSRCKKCGSLLLDAMAQPLASHFNDASDDLIELTAGVPETEGSGLDRPNPLGRYTIIKHLGQGGMATVYLAHDSQLDRQVALKIPRFSVQDKPDSLKRFFREAKVAAAFHHPNICPIYDVGMLAGAPYLTMAYIEGQSLADHLKELGHLIEVAEAVRLVRTLALTMQKAHDVGIIHRDLKPGNIMISTDGQPIVMDFGLARRNDSQESLHTRQGQMMGTPAYMPLEQFRGDRELIGPTCDIYSLGVILYRLLTGRIPYEGSPAAVFEKLVTSVPSTPPSLLRADVTPSLESVCLKAMAREIGDRYPSMGEFARALDDCPQRLIKQDRPGRRVAAGVLGIAGLLGVILYVATDNGSVKIPGTDPLMKALIDRHQVRTENRAKPPLSTADSKPVTKAASPAPASPEPEYITTRTGQIKLKLIPAGAFLMGSPGDDQDALGTEMPQHPVRITRSFYLGVYEVTQAQFETVMGYNPSYFSANGDGRESVAGQSTARHPVEKVSWLEAAKFCNRLSEKEALTPFYEIHGNKVRVVDWGQAGYRLPTEAEWEYACRANASTATRYSFGDGAASLGEFAWYNYNSGGKTQSVGEKRPNGFGLFDMHGNVWEWCWDGYAAYNDSHVDDPAELGGASYRVARGGSCGDQPRDVRSAGRNWFEPSNQYCNLGFRLALVQSGR